MLFETSQFADDVSSPLQPITQHNAMFPVSSDSMTQFSADAMPISVGAGAAVTANASTNNHTSSVADSAAITQQSTLSLGQESNTSSKESASGASASGGRQSTKSSSSSHRKRARATSEQVTVLESVFMVNRSPASRLREDLAARLGMAPRQVQVWFQNRRAKEKTQQRNPRSLQHHPSMVLDPMVYANMNPEFYSMAMATSFLPGSSCNPDPSATGAAAAGNPAFGASPVALSFGAAAGVGHPPQSAMQNQQHHALLDNQVAFAAAAAAANAASSGAANGTGASNSTGSSNPWMGWGSDFVAQHHQYQQQQQGHISPSLNHYLSMASGAAGMFSPTHINMPNNSGLHMGGPAGGANCNSNSGQPSGDEHLPMTAAASSAEKVGAGLGSSGGITASASSTCASATAAAAAALAHAINITDSRRESEVSGITAVASPTGPSSASMASDSIAASASSGTSPVTTPVVVAETAGAATLVSAAITPLAAPAEGTAQDATAVATATVAGSPGAKTEADVDAVPSGRATPATSSARLAGSVRRPAPLALVAHHHHPSMHMGHHGVPLGSGGIPLAASSASASAGGIPMGNRMGMPFSSFIPDIASYMVLDATRLTVGNWHRVPMPETELTCLACVEPPPLKPVQRPGNHRPAELDSLVGEFQWIIGSQGVRYKMVLPYSTISRIKFRETPDTAAPLVDVSAETVVNPQAALSLLSCALKNPNAKGELSIHVYDLPTFYFQGENGEWKDIGDFSENHCASSTYVHTISGSFVTLFCQLRILLATCSRLKIAGDPLMALWLGNMDDPYSAIAGIPHNSWLPCGNAVYLHSVKRNANASGSSTSHSHSHSHSNGEAAGGQSTTANVDASSEEHGGLVTSPLGHDSAAGSAAMLAGALPAFNMYIPTSAASSTIGTLTPTPTSMTGPHHMYNVQMGNMPPALGSARHSMFTFHDSNHQTAAAAAAAAAAAYHHSNLAAAAAMAGGVGQLPLKTQRSASLPFIRSAGCNANANTVKVNPSSSLCRMVDGDSPGPNESLEKAAGNQEASTDQQQQQQQQQQNQQHQQQQAVGEANALNAPGPSSGIASASNTPPPPAALPLRHRTSCNHIRRPAPYQVAPASGSSRVNSPQMSPSPFWYAHNLRRASRDSLSASFNHHHHHHHHQLPINQPTTPQGGTGFPNGVFVRRESDAELALAMNNAFSSGDVLGGHRGLSELYGMPVVPPSPLSNVTMASMMNAGSNRPSESLEMQVDGDGSNGKEPVNNVSNAINGAAVSAGMSNADIMMAIFNAMNSTAAIPAVSAAMSTVDANGILATNQAFLSNGGMPAMTATTTPMSMDAGFGSEAGSGSGNLGGFDPSAFMLPQTTDVNKTVNNSSSDIGGTQAMDWCFDWSLPATAPVQQQQQQHQHGLVGSEMQTPGNVSASYECDNESNKNESESSGRMNIDWNSKATAASEATS
ncbi:hypothetical protein FB639_002595 [Coemansia asiatica]|nr:hypothetical protein FB639_002595 [Coemansia asiatica]